MRAGIRFRCPYCGLQVMARRRQVGSRRHCPRCQADITVPSERDVQQRTSQLASIGEYNLAPPPPDRILDRVARIAVTCQCCGATVSAAGVSFGDLMSCPECGAVVVVPPPTRPPPLPESAAARSTGEYALAAPTATPSAPGDYIPVNCPVCHTRLMGARRQIGRKIVCPDCNSRVKVPEPAVVTRPQWDRSPGGDYLVSPPVELPKTEVLLPGVEDQARAREGEQVAAPPPESEPSLPPPDASLFFAGVFSFPFYSDVVLRWIILSAGGLLVQAVVNYAIRYANQPGFLTYVGSMLLAGMAGLISLLLIVPATAIWVAVLQRTADGYDHFDDWLEDVWLDWMLDGFFIFNSLCLSVVPGAAVAWLFQLPRDRALLVEAPLVMILFPIVLLSMLHQGSAWKPLSGAVVRSLWRGRWGWFMFYVAAILVLTPAAGLVWLLICGGKLMAALAIPGLAIASFIYFRLLGRLAWYCTGRGQ